ncbi:MAG: FkbM family methyltransferase [Treponema sp.]|jgi:FkbM family methyltransferase|nr:FkbM family methyltransferase [Treponema sp.]
MENPDDIGRRLRDIEIIARKADLLVKLWAEMSLDLSLGRKDGPWFQGQADQDVLAYLYFKGKRTGFFLDIGAYDGKTYSNTYALEQLGWKGVCLEPLPDAFARLRRNRRCDCYNLAMSDEPGKGVDFIRAAGVETLSGLESKMAPTHKDWIVREKGAVERIKVNTVTFGDLMGRYPGINLIDFLSLDVEGAEMSILESIDFRAYRFGLISIESIDETPGESEKLRTFMRERGYGVLLDVGLDLIFAPACRIDRGEEFPGAPVHVV